jgi:hypothetical protein
MMEFLIHVIVGTCARDKGTFWHFPKSSFPRWKLSLFPDKTQKQRQADEWVSEGWEEEKINLSFLYGSHVFYGQL